RDLTVTGVQTCALPILVAACALGFAAFLQNVSAVANGVPPSCLSDQRGRGCDETIAMVAPRCWCSLATAVSRQAMATHRSRRARSEERRVGKGWRRWVG